MLDPTRCCHPATDTALDVPPLSSFVDETVLEIVAVIKECPSKSSSFDRIPTSLVKKFADFLAVLITDIVNMSLSLGVFPDEMKLAYVTPLLKKPSLYPDDLNNYRPVSLLSFFS
jgi:hypothetical protein